MSDSSDRRAFIKRAGAVAWAVPAMSALNLSAAVAGEPVNTSVTDTTMGPTTTMATTTTAVMPCTCTLTLVSAQHTTPGSALFQLEVSLSGLCNAPPAMAEWFSPQNNDIRSSTLTNGRFQVPLFVVALPITISFTIYDALNEVADVCTFTFTEDMLPPLPPVV